MKVIQTLLIAVLLFGLSLQPNANNNPDEEKFVKDLLTKMTLAEKIGQLVEYVGTGQVTEKMLIEGRVSSILGIKDPVKANELQKIAVEKSRLGIPILFTNDVIHGYNTTFPIPLATAASFNPKLVEEASSIAAIEAASQGTHLTFAPMVDIARDARWGRIAEGAGEDPYLGGVMAAAFVRGFQGNDIKSKSTIGACAKHYVAYGVAEAGRDYNTADISERTLREIYLPPFKAACDEGVVSIMSAFNDLNGIPASANHFTLTEILRDEWGWDGFVISDYNSIGELVAHRFAKDKAEAGLKAITAGVDIDMVGDKIVGNCYAPYLDSLVTNGLLDKSVIDEAVRRVLRIKYRLGLFDHPYVDFEYYEKNMPSFKTKQDVALRVAKESIVLLKNENNILPLDKNIKSIAIIGELADNVHHPIGPWNCSPQLENVVTPLMGIKNIVSSKTEITFARSYFIVLPDTSGFREAMDAVNKSEIVIMILGEVREMSGEAASRSNIDIPGIQMKLLDKILETRKPVIAVLMNGRPLTLTELDMKVPAIIESWYLGDQHGNALAQVLFGEYNPSGKLPVSFPRTVGQIPIYYNYKSTGRPYKEEDKFTSKYLDVENAPLYPFGFGLSYTTYEYSNLTIIPKSITLEENVTVTVDITNTGDYPGDETIQLYIKDCYSSVTRPVKELKGFEKIHLEPGETKKITFIITPGMLSFLDINMKRIIEPGDFEIMVGGNSVDFIKANITVKAN